MKQFIQRKSGSFDSSISYRGRGPTKNVTLKIQLRICFLPVSAGTVRDGDNKPFQALQWDSSALKGCRNYIKATAEGFWNEAFWLKTPWVFDGFDYVQRGKRPYRCNVDCKFELVCLSNPRFAHHVVRFVRLADNDPNGFQFRSNAVLWDNYDLLPTVFTSAKGTQHVQLVYLHEIAHLMGIHHIGVDIGKCTVGNQNAMKCYEGKTPEQTGRIGGLGMGLTVREAKPWVRRIAEHTGEHARHWEASRVRLRPTPIFP